MGRIVFKSVERVLCVLLVLSSVALIHLIEFISFRFCPFLEFILEFANCAQKPLSVYFSANNDEPPTSSHQHSAQHSAHALCAFNSPRRHLHPACPPVGDDAWVNLYAL